VEIVGILSAFSVLGAFIANQYGWVSNDNIWYDVANLIAACGLFAYAYSLGGWPFMLTNAVWAAVSAIDVVRYLLGHRPHKNWRKPRLH
jgi:hypothetical protein